MLLVGLTAYTKMAGFSRVFYQDRTSWKYEAETGVAKAIYLHLRADLSFLATFFVTEKVPT